MPTKSRAWPLALTLLLSASAHPRPLEADSHPDAAPAIDVATAVSVLFAADSQVPPPGSARCVELPAQAQIPCFIDLRFRQDPKAATIAQELFANTGVVAGLLPAQRMDGAYRGILHLVPELPVHENRHHLGWLSSSLQQIDAFYGTLREKSPSVRYRSKPTAVRFFRSVKRRTPSATALDWIISYNVAGSLFKDERRVRETLVHEIFHLNDQQRSGWSRRVLAKVYRAIVEKCGTDKKCLKPYTPDELVVIGGTYYAFMPDNGVAEYAADLAKRYYIEQTAQLRGQPVQHPFKCQTLENGEAWRLLVHEFYGGVDHVPPC